MGGDATAVVATLMCLVLVGAGLAARRLPGPMLVRYALGWLAIFAVLTAILVAVGV